MPDLIDETHRPTPVSYSGRRVQTRYFRENDAAWLRANAAAGRALVSAGIMHGSRTEVKAEGIVILHDVDVRHILAFLADYQVHEDSPIPQPRLMAAYIRAAASRRDSPSLLTWNIAIMGGPVADQAHEVAFSDHVRVGTIVRSKLATTGGSKADIKTLMSKDHAVVDMAITAAEARKRTEAELLAMRNTGYADRGLLLLYPISKDSLPEWSHHPSRAPLQALEHVIAMAAVFPRAWSGTVSEQAASDAADPSALEAEVLDAMAGRPTRLRASQGRLLTAAERKAVELRAVELATAYFEIQGWTVRDVGATESYDLELSRDGRHLYVEVKGTTSSGMQVILTRSEVDHQRRLHPENALVVVHSIKLDRDSTPPVASGGTLHCRSPWVVADDDLTVVSYLYATGL